MCVLHKREREREIHILSFLYTHSFSFSLSPHILYTDRESRIYTSANTSIHIHFHLSPRMLYTQRERERERDSHSIFSIHFHSHYTLYASIHLPILQHLYIYTYSLSPHIVYTEREREREREIFFQFLNSVYIYIIDPHIQSEVDKGIKRDYDYENDVKRHFTNISDCYRERERERDFENIKINILKFS